MHLGVQRLECLKRCLFRYTKKKKTKQMATSTSVMSSLSLKPASVWRSSSVKGVPSLARSTASFTFRASGGRKIKTDKPFGIGGGMDLKDGVDSSGRKGKGKGVYQFVDKYGANVDGYSPIYNKEKWSPSGDVYVGGTTGLLIWDVTLVGLLAGGALLVYNTSALAS